MIRIHFTYRPTEQPGGGANNFIRALKAAMLANGGFTFTDTLDEPCDILFMNELNQGAEGAAERLKLDAVRRQMRIKRAESNCRLIVRAVNLRRHAQAGQLSRRGQFAAWRADRGVLGLLDLADFAIFQSHYQRSFFAEYGFRNPMNRIIFNGAGPFFRDLPARHLGDGKPLVLVSATASPRATKGHALIARMAAVPGVEVCHFGRWPEHLPVGAVTLMGVASHDEMAATFARAHGFLHPAVSDPCPNAMIEGLSAGLPVIYNGGPGSSGEIVGKFGLPLDCGDPGKTVAEFRERHAEFCAGLEQNRSFYLIDRAASEYMAVFQRIAETR